MSQKAICPRGHVWDPSTLGGLPPSEKPRCPICGEEEPPRIRHLLGRMGRWCRDRPGVVALTVLCLLSAVFLIYLVRARTELLAAREQAEIAQLRAQQVEVQQRVGMRFLEAKDKQPQQNRQIELQGAKWEKREKEFEAQLREARKNALDARKQRDEQYEQRKLAEELAQTADQVRKEALEHRAEVTRQLIKMNVAAGTRLMDSNDLSASLVWFTDALRLAEKERLPTQIHRLRLAYVLRRCPRPVQMWLQDKTLNVVQLSSDGKRVLTAGGNGAVEVWDAGSGKRIGDVLAHDGVVTHAEFSPDGKHVLTAAVDMTLHLWDVEMAKEQFTALQFMGPVAGLAFSLDGKRFLTVTDKAAMGATEVELRIWDSTTGEAIREHALGSDISPRPAAFSPEGTRVLTICQDHCARIWDIATGKQIGPAFSHAAELVKAGFDTDGERVLTASVDGTVRVWRAKTGEPVTPLFKHGSVVRGASLSADGRHALTLGEDRAVRVWDVNRGDAEGQPLRQSEVVLDAVFSPDARYVLATCADGTARILDYRTSDEVLPALRHGGPIRYAAFTPGGDGLLTLEGRLLRLWDLTAGEPAMPPSPPREAGLEVFSPDGKRVLRATETTVRVYDTQTNQPVGGTLPHKDNVTAAAFTPDGKRVLTVCHQRNGDELEGYVRVWETATGELLGQPLVHPRSVIEAGFSREGRRVLTACQDGKARLWDVEKNAVVGEPMEHQQDLRRALFLPDGKRLLTVDAEGGLRLWDADTAEAVGPTWGHRRPINHLSVSPDGQQLLTASEDGTASVWEASTGREIAATPAQGAPILQADFSPDGKRIVTVSGDRRVRVWEAANGKPISPPLRHRASVSLAAFSDDGKLIVTAAADGVRLWDAATGEAISPPLHSSLVPRNAQFLKSLVRDFRPDDRPTAELVRMAEVMSAERRTDASELIPLDGAELNKQWRELHDKYSKDFSPSPSRLAAWHQRGAEDCEHQHLWMGTLQHLGQLITSGPSVDLYARRGRANLELNRWEPAKTDYTQALAGASERWDLWAGRAQAEGALGRWEEALADYSKAIDRKGNRAELWAARGRIEAERGDWRKAAADFAKAIQLGEQDVTVWRQHILTLLASGDEANYRRWCGRMLQRFGDSKDDAVFRSVVWAIALGPDAVQNWKPLILRGERVVNSNPQSADNRRQLAVLLYRAGQFDAALKRLQEAVVMTHSEPTPLDGLLTAMAAQRLGRTEEEKKGLLKANEVRHDRVMNGKESWEERLMYETLHREAETLMKGGKR
jgi:WD40 repeat protein/tetratricopeptide (TPR) repeat protein